MSTRIVDDFVAVRFDHTALKAVFDHHSFYDDRILFFELGGSNNLTRRHPTTGREVRARSWEAVAAGPDWKVMAAMVGFSAACEGGCMRLHGNGRTLPETYIRRARDAVRNAAPFAQAEHLGLSVAATLQYLPPAEPSQYEADTVSTLSAQLAPRQIDGAAQGLQWTLQPLRDIKHAALFFAFHHLDKRETWNIVQVHGPEYAGYPLLSRLPRAA